MGCLTVAVDEERAAAEILAAVERAGVLLVHDRWLPSATAIVAGGPVAGSWWSHPAGTTIYNALEAVEESVAEARLLKGKYTLVARRLWPALAGVALGRSAWQLRDLDRQALGLLAQVDASSDPVVVDRPRRAAGNDLERRLLVCGVQVHTPAGHHVKAYHGWQSWAQERDVAPWHDERRARAAFEEAVATLPDHAGRLLPW